jgi:hypothetical protein
MWREAFKGIKYQFVIAHVLILSNIQQFFVIELDSFAMGMVSVQH